MSESPSPRRLGQSIGALLAGFVVVVVLSLGTDSGLRAGGIFPALGQSMSDALFMLATLYRTVYGVLGSYLTARLAPYRPMLHALAGGAVGFVLTTAGTLATWAKMSLGPHWYPVALIALAMPTAWAGGKLSLSRLNARASG